MRKKKSLCSMLIAGSALCIILTACGGEPKEESDVTIKTIEVEGEEEKAWQYDHSSTKVIWTGYKLASKAGVEGRFDSIVVNGFTPGPNAAECITGVKYELFTTSTETADTSRNRKIITRFFGEMIEGAKITGEIKSIDPAAGSGVVSVNMNGVERTLDVTYEMDEDNVVKLVGTIDIPAWNAQSALDSLNKVCYEKHEGITWPDAEVKIYTRLKK